MTTSGRVEWLPTPTLSTGIGLTAFLPLLAIGLSRPDLLIVAIPIAVSTVVGLLTRSFRLPTVTAKPRATTLLEGEYTELEWDIAAEEILDVVQLQVRVRGWIELPEGGSIVATSVQPGPNRQFAHKLASTRWGRGQLEDVVMTAFTAQGMLRAERIVPLAGSIRILPLREGFTAIDAVPSAAGVVGLHRSRRPGEGIDLAGVRPFVAGDRLRRINWPVSTRTGALHVTSTFSERDVEVVVVLDSSVEIGESLGEGSSASTIDQAVRAAGSIAEHYLRNGDRVGLLDLARPSRPIRSRAGRSQLNNILEILLEVRPGQLGLHGAQRALSRIPANALVIVLSPLLSDEVGEALAGLTRAGRSMIVVDTMPERVSVPEVGPWTQLAWRVQMLRRDNLSASMAAHGVPVVPWLGSGSLDAVLLGLSRMATAARAIR